MKKNKFRGWHKEAKEMLCEYEIGKVLEWIRQGQPIISMQYIGIKDGTEWYELTEKEREQWMVDGNMPSEWDGKEIYEGDILIMHDGINGDYEIKVMDIREIDDELKYYNKCAKIVRNYYNN